jgi:DNA-binding MarR family transcriptional regulator
MAAGRKNSGPGSALPIDSSLFFKLTRVVNLTARPFVETLSRTHHLTLNEWRTMVVLASHPGVAARDVAEATGLDKMSVSRALASLERQGRLQREPDPADARSARLALSADGQALYRTIGTLAAVREAQLFSGISAAEQATMGATIDRLIAALSASEPEQAQSR